LGGCSRHRHKRQAPTNNNNTTPDHHLHCTRCAPTRAPLPRTRSTTCPTFWLSGRGAPRFAVPAKSLPSAAADEQSYEPGSTQSFAAPSTSTLPPPPHPQRPRLNPHPPTHPPPPHPATTMTAPAWTKRRRASSTATRTTKPVNQPPGAPGWGFGLGVRGRGWGGWRLWFGGEGSVRVAMMS